jgi:hypothetical protein
VQGRRQHHASAALPPLPRYIFNKWAGIAQSVQQLATGWTVRGSNPGGSEIFRSHPDRPWGPPNLLYNGYRVSFPGVKRPGRGVDHPPPSSAEVKERVEVYLYSPSGPLWPVLGRTLHIEYETGWASEPVWTFWIRAKNVSPVWDSNWGSFSSFPCRYIDYGIQSFASGCSIWNYSTGCLVISPSPKFKVSTLNPKQPKNSVHRNFPRTWPVRSRGSRTTQDATCYECSPVMEFSNTRSWIWRQFALACSINNTSEVSGSGCDCCVQNANESGDIQTAPTE